MSRWQTCLKVITQYEARNNITFDWIWKLRLDLQFNFPVPHVSLLDPDLVYTNNWRARDAWSQIELFFLAPRKHADIVFNAVDLVECKHAVPLSGEGGRCQTSPWIECLLVGLLQHFGITFRVLPWQDADCQKSEIECLASKWVWAT